jgi:hypothetical protein
MRNLPLWLKHHKEEQKEICVSGFLSLPIIEERLCKLENDFETFIQENETVNENTCAIEIPLRNNKSDRLCYVRFLCNDENFDHFLRTDDKIIDNISIELSKIINNRYTFIERLKMFFKIN